jgi:putative transposase
MRKVVRRQRLDAQGWRDLVARQVESGLSAREFCEREGVKVWTLYGWRSRLRAGREGPRAPAKHDGTQPSARFIELGGLKGASSKWEIHLDLGDGISLQLVRG